MWKPISKPASRQLPHLRPRQAVLGRVLADELRERVRHGGADRRGRLLDLRGEAGERLLGAGAQGGRAKRRAWVEAAVRRRLQALPPEPVRSVEPRPGQEERGGASEAPQERRRHLEMACEVVVEGDRDRDRPAAPAREHRAVELRGGHQLVRASQVT